MFVSTCARSVDVSNDSQRSKLRGNVALCFYDVTVTTSLGEEVMDGWICGCDTGNYWLQKKGSAENDVTPSFLSP